jgi:CRP-like cAMP-binding protein
LPFVPKLVHILDEDPDLALALLGPRRSVARRRALAPVVELEPGLVDLLGAYGTVSGWFGLLVLDGLILQHSTLLGRSTTDVLGTGDVFCPWQIEEDSPVLPASVEFEALTHTRIALLDADFAERVRPWPEIASVLIGRADRRARGRTVARGLADYPRVDVRVVGLLWELAERCGVVVADGIVAVPLRLTHRTLARMVGCERSSVSSALGSLRRDGLIAGGRSGWLLTGSLPQQVEFLLDRGTRRPFTVVRPGGKTSRARGFPSSSTG